VAEPTIDIEAIAAVLPRRIHEVMERYVAEIPDHAALIEDGTVWSYRDLDRHVREVAGHLGSLGVRPGDRVMIVSENCIALGRCCWRRAGSTPGRSSPIRGYRRASST
jgi:long-chain acyl-CoA synthetase